MIEFNINTVDVERMIGKTLDALDDTRPLMESIGQLVRTSIVLNFVDEGRPKRWKKSWRVEEEGGQTLSDSGRLKNSISYAVKGKYSVAVGPGADVPYAAIHHFGGVIKPKKKNTLRFKGPDGQWYMVKKVTIPARPFVLLQIPDDEDDIKDIIVKHLERGG